MRRSATFVRQGEGQGWTLTDTSRSHLFAQLEDWRGLPTDNPAYHWQLLAGPGP